MSNYNLNGGIMPKNGGIPLKKGYSFGGWQKDGDTLTATWNECAIPEARQLETKYIGRDDGLVNKAGGCPISSPYEDGTRGEAVYKVKTVYTDITVDGTKDPAYDYGLHLKGALSNDPAYYEGRDTSIEVWMIRGQNGKAYVYGEVTDSDIVHNDELYKFKAYHCDSIDVYVDFGNVGSSVIVGQLHATEDAKYQKKVPAEYAVIMTDKGFAFEYSFDNKGKPFFNDDEIAFSFYYNDANEYVNNDNYKRGIVKLPSSLCPEGSKYVAPNSKNFDTVIFSDESASGAFEYESPVVPEKTDDVIADIFSGARTVSIVISKLATGQVVVGARRVMDRLLNCGIKSTLTYQGITVSPKKTDVEIIMDKADFEESRELYASIDYNGYALAIKGSKILVAAYMEDAFKAAEGLLVSALEYVKNGGKTADLGERYEGKLEGMICAPTMDGMTMFTDAGSGSYLLLKLGADEADYKAYYAKLLAEGFKVYTENRIESVRFATFYNDKLVINLSYGEAEKDRSLRAVVDTREINALPALKKEEYTPVCKSSITQLAPSTVIWMCYIVKLDNGEYFIIDAGQNHAYNHIYNKLMEMSGGEDVTVACWLFTHFHNDHIGGFVNLCENDEMMKKIHVKSVIYNFPQRQVLDTAPGACDQNNVAKWEGLLDKHGILRYQARTGQKYYFGNAELELLFTYEDLMPFNILHDRTNPTSHIFSMKIDGQRFIMTGDACGEATCIVVDRYGEGLKADFVQLPHHGWGDGGTSLEFYKIIGAKWVLYPSSGYWPSPSEKWMCEHCEKYFLGLNNDMTIEIPYKGE